MWKMENVYVNCGYIGFVGATVNVGLINWATSPCN